MSTLVSSFLAEQCLKTTRILCAILLFHQNSWHTAPYICVCVPPLESCHGMSIVCRVVFTPDTLVLPFSGIGGTSAELTWPKLLPEDQVSTPSSQSHFCLIRNNNRVVDGQTMTDSQTGSMLYCPPCLRSMWYYWKMIIFITNVSFSFLTKDPCLINLPCNGCYLTCIIQVALPRLI